MNINQLIATAIQKNTACAVCDIVRIGKGASGAVYRVTCDGVPKEMAVKVSEHPVLMQQEYRMLAFLKEKTASKIPAVYFFDTAENVGIIAMEYINGISGADKKLQYRFGKRHLAESIVDNLLVIQQAHHDKFGPVDHAVYDTWQAYYKEFADEIHTFSEKMFAENKLDKLVMQAVEQSYCNFDKIFAEEKSVPTLIHGDYWMPNFIIDPKNMELLAAVDPFNVMWAEPEYELFAMTVGYGKKLQLYEIYKRKVRVSKYCDLKLELYALYSELLWYKKLGTIGHDYLQFRAKRLLRQMKKNKMI